MNKRQAQQLQQLFEELLLDNLDELLKESRSTLSSATGSLSDSVKDLKGNLDRSKLEALGVEAMEAMDREKLERWVREAVRSLDTDKLEKWARASLAAVDSDKLKQLLNDKLRGLDKRKLESLIKDNLRYIDRRKLEARIRERLQTVDLDKLKSAARHSLSDIDLSSVEGFVNDRVDKVILARLDTLKAADLEVLLASKRAAEKLEVTKNEAAKNEAVKVVDQEEKESSNPIATVIGTMGKLAFFGAAGWIAYSHLFLEHQVPLPKAIAAELLTLAYRPSGPLNVYQDRSGSGRPLLLIHSVNAGASSYEMRPLFQHYRGKRPVFALDLPGFGFSARSKIVYTPEVYVNAILTALTGIDAGPVDVVALSLGSEFAAEAARRRPELVNSLTLISPSGLNKLGTSSSSQSINATGIDSFVYPMLSFRLWARPFYDLLTTRQSITYFLQKSFVGAIPEGMVDYCISTSHQPGAENAPLYFVAGKLFTPNALERIYRQVQVPSLIIYDRDGFVSFDRLPELLAVNKAWQATRVSPTMGLPHWEKLEATTEALEKFWQGVQQPA